MEFEHGCQAHKDRQKQSFHSDSLFIMLRNMSVYGNRSLLYMSSCVYVMWRCIFWSALIHKCPEISLYIVRLHVTCDVIDSLFLGPTQHCNYCECMKTQWISLMSQINNYWWQLTRVRCQSECGTLFSLHSKSHPGNLSQAEKKALSFCVLHKVEAVMLLWWMNQSKDSWRL